MKRITRATMRGKPLDDDCRKIARSDSGQYGPNDRRCFCTGIIDMMNDEYLPKCRSCRALNIGAWPLDEGEEAYKAHMDIYG